MKNIGFMALSLALSAATVHASERPVKLSFSGNSAASPVNLQQPGTDTGEENVAGVGTLGDFSFRNITSQTTTPQQSDTCSGANQIYFVRVSGGGIFRFKDGSLLNVKLIQGGDCVDLAAQVGHCTLTLQITGGTGRFQDATGNLTYTEVAMPVLSDVNNNPVFFTETGQITGTISGASLDAESQEGTP